MLLYFHYRNDPDHIEWDSPLKTERCHFTKSDGHRCKRQVTLGLPHCFQHRTKVRIKPSTIPNAGQGLFAYDPHGPNIVFHKNDKITPYYGQLRNEQKIIQRYGRKTAPYGLQLSHNRYTDGATQRGLGTLLNHKTRKNNARFSVARNQQEVNLVATKNIRNNEEVFVNYGREYRFQEPGTEYSTNRSKYKV